MLEDIKKEGDKAVEKTKKRIAKELSSKKAVIFNNYALVKIKESLGKILEIKVDKLSLDIPPEHIKTDLSLALFGFTGQGYGGNDPKKLAQDWAKKINETKNEFIESAQAFGPYLNINLKKQKIYSSLLKDVSKLKDKFGRSDLNAKKVAVIDYSGTNIAKFKKVYERLGIKFDAYLGESYFAGETDKLVEECLEKKLAKKDEETGAIAVENLEGLPSFLLRKKDDSGLYITRDLAALIFRVEVFEPDSILYVVGEEQSLHFRQLFALARALGYIDGAKAEHIGFGLVLSGGEKMSTRKGTLIELDELIKQSVEKSKEILRQKNKDLSEKEIEEISEIIGLGAVVYNDLRQSRQKNISFDWKRMLDFEGGSAVYLQYTVARINSILKKLSQTDHQGPSLISRTVLDGLQSVFEKESEFALARKMMFFPVVILEAQKHNSPHLIAVYLEELAQLFNHFYNEVSIIGTEDANLRLSRISLIKSVATVIKNGLKLLGVKTPEKI